MTNSPQKEETLPDIQHVPFYKVLLHNDDHNSMDRVAKAIVQVFKYDFRRAFDLMMEAHNNGISLLKVEPQELAELHREQLQSLGLTSTIEKA